MEEFMNEMDRLWMTTDNLVDIFGIIFRIIICLLLVFTAAKMVAKVKKLKSKSGNIRSEFQRFAFSIDRAERKGEATHFKGKILRGIVGVDCMVNVPMKDGTMQMVKVNYITGEGFVVSMRDAGRDCELITLDPIDANEVNSNGVIKGTNKIPPEYLDGELISSELPNVQDDAMYINGKRGDC